MVTSGRNNADEAGIGSGKENIDINHALFSTTMRKKRVKVHEQVQETERMKASPNMSATRKSQGLRVRTPQTEKPSSSNYHHQQSKKGSSFSLSPAMMDTRLTKKALSTVPSKIVKPPTQDDTLGSPFLSSNLGSTNITNDSQRRVLLFGETMESLFGVTESSDDEQHRLCRSIIDGSHVDDPGTWRRVLQLAESQHNSGGKETNCVNLVRLHRRATLRFPLDQKSHAHTMTNENRREILEIWLSSARVHVQNGNLDEARRTFRVLENNLKLLLSGNDDSFIPASFYLEFADFERIHFHDAKLAQEIILRGLQEKAKPSSLLEHALTTLREQEQPHVSKQYHEGKALLIEPKHSSPIRNEKDAVAGRKRSPERLSVSEKRSKSKTESGPQKLWTHEPALNKSVVFDKRDEIAEVQNSSKENRKVVTVTSSSTPHSYSDSTTMKTPKQLIANVTSTCDTALGKPPAAQRSSLTSRLTRKGLSGKAKRVEAEKSILLLDNDNTSESENEENTCSINIGDLQERKQVGGLGEAKSSAEKCKKPLTIKKLDLGYMWAWDPNSRQTGRGVNHPTEKQLDEGATSSGQSTNATQGTSSSTHGSGSSADSVASCFKEEEQSHGSGKKKLKMQPAGQIDSIAVDNHESLPYVRSDVRSNEKKENGTTTHERSFVAREHALVANANLDFLPLVHENNILKVNGSSYVKLGVVGKGGSCKVYRALSKKCAVVAIKKVKLDGMDKKAIDGYANEISLLRRLRGNPAIIQMYDSEVDLKRKSIYLVMELGEVDLNYVLQQRALADTSRSLNMNFIRLTWQQMLSAVHCIHEERIIHSDLKPANFLFVRGALKLIDFGIAKAIANEDTTKIYRESHIGTLNYMSPESILDTGSGKNGPRMKIGRASDVWSLGCILYEMVYGKTPFANLHFVQKLQAIINDDYRIDFPEADESSVDAMKLCLRRNPDERPPIMGKDGLLNEHCFLHSSRRTK
jgi:serine/threonine-protein kinase TTK/MPS1